jgi:hypothetical protein
MTIKSGLISGLAFLLVSHAAAAQAPNRLVGAWERVAMTDARGVAAKPEPAFLLFSADGHFAQTVTPSGRPKSDKPLQDMTREELLARFQGLQARFGAYTVAGDRLTRRNIAHVNPGAEGSQETQVFRIDHDLLILTTEGEKGEVRFKRLEPAK